MTNRLVKNTVINIANTGLGFVIAYAMTPIILHRLGVEQYGLWSFLSIFTVSGYFSLLDFGFQGATIKYVAEYHAKQDHERLQDTITATIIFFAVVGLLGGALVWVFDFTLLPHVFHLPSEQLPTIQGLVAMLAASFLVQFPTIGFSAVLEGLQRYDILRSISIVVTIVMNVAIVAWMKSDHGVAFLVMTIIASGVLMAVSYAIAIRLLLPGMTLRRSALRFSAWRQLFTLSSKLFLSKIVGLIFNNTDKILIAVLLTVSVQTDYDIVNKLHIILLSILSIMNQAVLPAASAAEAAGDTTGLRRLLLLGTKYSVAMVIPMWLFLVVLPGQAITMWVGPSFTPLAPVVVLYVSHIVITMLVGVSSTMLVGVDKVGQVLKISLWAAVVNLVISGGTAHWLGIRGLILGTVVAYIISSLLYVRATNRMFGITTRDFLTAIFRPIALPVIIVVPLLLGVKHFLPTLSFLIGLLVVMGLYAVFGLVFLRTGISPTEKAWLRARWQTWRKQPTTV